MIIGRLIAHPSRLSRSSLLPRPALVAVDFILQSAVVYVAASIGLAVFMAADLSKPRPKWIVGGMPSFTVSLPASLPSRIGVSNVRLRASRSLLSFSGSSRCSKSTLRTTIRRNATCRHSRQRNHDTCSLHESLLYSMHTYYLTPRLINT